MLPQTSPVIVQWNEMKGQAANDSASDLSHSSKEEHSLANTEESVNRFGIGYPKKLKSGAY